MKDSYYSYLSVSIAANLLWSASFVGTKLAYASFPPMTLGALRITVAALLLGFLVFAGGKRERLEKGDLKTVTWSGFLGITLYFSMENIGIKLTSASTAALIVASYPAITVMLERLFYKVPISRAQVVGIAVAMTGVGILTGAQENRMGANELWGNCILFAAGFVWALYNFSTRKVVNKYSSIPFAFYQTTAAAIFFLPLALLEIDDWQIPTPISIFALLYLALLCSVTAHMLYNFGLRRLSAGVAVSLMNLVPFFGVMCSAFVLGEPVSVRQIAGGIIVIIGVFFSLKKNTPFIDGGTGTHRAAVAG